MVTTSKTWTAAAVAAITLGAAVAATTTPAHALIGVPRYDGYYDGPGAGHAAGTVVGNAIAAGSYPYYGGPHAGIVPYGAPYGYPYPGYGFYYGY